MTVVLVGLMSIVSIVMKKRVKMTELELLKAENDKLRAQNAELRDALQLIDQLAEGNEEDQWARDVSMKALASDGSRVEELVEALEEVYWSPYEDSSPESLLETLRARAITVLKKWRGIEK